MVLAVDDVADAADREAEPHAGRAGVRPLTDGQATPHRGDEAAEGAEDRGAPDGDPAGPDLGDEEWVPVVAAGRPAVDDVHEPGPEDPRDHGDGRDAIRRVLVHVRSEEPHRQPDAEEDADGREDPVPRERDRSEMDVRVERYLDQLTSGAGGQSPTTTSARGTS